MRGGSHDLLCMAAVLFAVTPCARAQIFELSAGASSIYGAEGGSVVIHQDDTETILGGGVMQGHLALGGSSSKPIAGGTATAGQQELGMQLPTDLFNTNAILAGTGLGLRVSHAQSGSFTAFGGYASSEGGTQLFRTSNLQELLAYSKWVHPLGKKCTSSATMLFSRQMTALESVGCNKNPRFFLGATIGVGANAPYAAVALAMKRRRWKFRGSYTYAADTFQRTTSMNEVTPEPVKENLAFEYKMTSALSFSVLHARDLTPVSWKGVVDGTSSTLPVHSELDTIAVDFQTKRTGWGVNLLHSSSDATANPTFTNGGSSEARGNKASSFIFRESFGKVQWTENLMHTYGSGTLASSILVNGISVALSPHIRLSESANVTASGTTYSHGGTLLTSFSSFEVDYQFFYVATRPEHPFEQAMVFDAQLKLPRDLSLHAASNVSPSGQMLYTVRLSTLLVRNAAPAEPLSSGGLGMSTLRGRVMDRQGLPIEGAALRIGNERVYTDSEGIFFFREKHAQAHEFSVMTSEFLGVGDFVAYSAPAQVRSREDGESLPAILVIVDRAAAATDSVKREGLSQ
jgi:hypothetical protein